MYAWRYFSWCRAVTILLSWFMFMVQLKFLKHLIASVVMFVSFSALAVTYSDAICVHISGSSSNGLLLDSSIVLRPSICSLIVLVMCFLYSSMCFETT